MDRVIFACVHNAGRSQMAAAFFDRLADPGRARAVSAGTAPGARVHPEVVEAMREAGIDLAGASPQRLTPELATGAALLVTMGCGDACPAVPGLERDDWPLEDPKGKPVARVREIRDEIRDRVRALVRGRGWEAASGEGSSMLAVKGYAARDPRAPLAPFDFDRRPLRPRDVQIEVLYCGVCHSDLHQARNEWKNTTYPLVPGHEIVGRVARVGPQVKAFAEGDLVGVGCLVDSCRACASCKEGLEQYCDGFVGTYNSRDRVTGEPTYGGYSTAIVVDEDFVLRVPKQLALEGVAPLLCAGITTYSPLRRWKVGSGHRVAIVGLGGLGHMGVKLAHALGAHVTLLTTSPGKAADARRLGADEVLISTDADALAKQAQSFDFVLDTVSAPHDLNAYLGLVKRDGTLCLVGAPELELPVHPFSVIFKRRQLAGSLIGGIPETQEMLDFCGKHGIVSDVEVIPIQKINEAYERMLKSDVKYRFVIDMASLR